MSNVARVSGALHLVEDQLTGDMILTLDIGSGAVALTTLDQLRSYINGGGMARIDIPVTIPSGAGAFSDAGELVGGASLSGIILPTGFLATSLIFQASEDDDTYYPVYAPNGALWSIPVLGTVGSPGLMMTIPQNEWLRFNYLKIASSISQTTTREVTLIATL